MAFGDSEQRHWGYRWRSSTTFVLLCIAVALFAETFLFGFVVPILPHILQDRNHVDPSDVQRLTYQILSLYGGVSVASALFIGQLADLAKSRQMPLVTSLGIAFVGTLMLAASTNLYGVYIGRVLQAIGGTAAWIVGLATVRDSTEVENMGKVFGLMHSCVTVGAISGPAVAGLLFELAGYWTAWGSVLLVLVLDIGMRLVMLEKPRRTKFEPEDVIDDCDDRRTVVDEECPLLSDNTAQTHRAAKMKAKDGDKEAKSFYRIIFTQRRVIIALACSVTSSAMLSSYNTTIPTHVERAFGWGSLLTGLLFATLQGPAIVLSPLCGWFRDKFGTRLPAALGFAVLGPLVWLLGAANQEQFPWAASMDSAKRAYIVAIIGIGCATNLTTSVGTIEITCAAKDLESKNPGVFGPNGGHSRCYSISNLSFATGLLLGSFLSGLLTDAVGYYYMNTMLACLSIILSILAFTFLEGRSPSERINNGNRGEVEEQHM